MDIGRGEEKQGGRRMANESGLYILHCERTKPFSCFSFLPPPFCAAVNGENNSVCILPPPLSLLWQCGCGKRGVEHGFFSQNVIDCELEENSMRAKKALC